MRKTCGTIGCQRSPYGQFSLCDRCFRDLMQRVFGPSMTEPVPTATKTDTQQNPPTKAADGA